MSEQIEKVDSSDEKKIVARWIRELSIASARENTWRERAKNVLKRYRDEDDKKEAGTKFNILYSNTEVLRGVIYQKTPVPDVRRRFLDKDPVGRDASQVLQRSLSYCADQYDFDGIMNSVVEDYLLPGRALAKIRYVPTYSNIINEETGEAEVDDETGEPAQQVVYETVETDYVDWEMVRISPAKRWAKVRWIAFGELLTRDELITQFGDVGRKCTLDWSPQDAEENEIFKRALVWSIWDKKTKKVHVICRGSPDKRLAVHDDPLNLEGFFPCPEPIYAVKNTSTMVPIPEYAQYQDQAMELDELTARISALTEELRRRGVYDASYSELGRLSNAKDGEFIPVEKLSNLAEKGGISAALMELPIEGVAKVLIQLVQQRESVKQIIYETTGIADVVRGVSMASETLGAQQLKARYSNSRTGPRQKAIQVFARDLFRLKAEIISEKFSVQTLATMTGFDLALDVAEKQQLQFQAQSIVQSGQQVPAALAKKLKKPTWQQITDLLRNDKLRGFRVDIETDSTVIPDMTEEQKNRVELLQAITGFLERLAPAVQMGALPKDIAKELLTFGIRAFKVSPQLEDALDSLGDEDGQDNQIKQQMQAAQQQIQAAQQELDKQKQEAERVIQQAKDAMAKADSRLMKVDYEEKIKQIIDSMAAREEELARKEREFEVKMAELEIERKQMDAERKLRGIAASLPDDVQQTLIGDGE